MKVYCHFPRVWKVYKLPSLYVIEIHGDASVNDVVRQLCNEGGETLQSLLIDSEGQRKVMITMENDVITDESLLKDKDSLTFTLPISGG